MSSNCASADKTVQNPKITHIQLYSENSHIETAGTTECVSDELNHDISI